MMKKFIAVILSAMLSVFLISCGSQVSSEDELVTLEQKEQNKNIVIGFSQLGAESDWRSANTESMLLRLRQRMDMN